MKPVVAIYDDFLDDVYQINRMIEDAEFRDVTNPVDGVTYKKISYKPPGLKRMIMAKLEACAGVGRIFANAMFIRLMTNDTPESQVHVDQSMGEFASHIYLSPKWPPDAGTQFWYHRRFGSRFPRADQFDGSLSDLHKLCASPCNWERRTFVGARRGRAVIHDASLWHSAEPAGGFGTGPEDGRIVLTTFFSRSAK